MEQPQQRAVQVRFNNDSAAAVTLLWHKQMEGGLVVAQEIATIAGLDVPAMPEGALGPALLERAALRG